MVNAERCPGCCRGHKDLCYNDSFSISDGAASPTSLRDGFLNRVVTKEFGGVVHRGVVVALAKDRNTYLISYDDGDREEVCIAELSGMLIGRGRVPATLKEAQEDIDAAVRLPDHLRGAALKGWDLWAPPDETVVHENGLCYIKFQVLDYSPDVDGGEYTVRYLYIVSFPHTHTTHNHTNLGASKHHHTTRAASHVSCSRQPEETQRCRFMAPRAALWVGGCNALIN